MCKDNTAAVDGQYVGERADAPIDPRAYAAATQQRAGQGEYVDLLSVKRKQEDEYAQQMVRERRMQTLGYALASFGSDTSRNAAEVVARAAAFDRYVTEGAA